MSFSLKTAEKIHSRNKNLTLRLHCLWLLHKTPANVLEISPEDIIEKVSTQQLHLQKRKSMTMNVWDEIFEVSTGSFLGSSGPYETIEIKVSCASLEEKVNALCRIIWKKNFQWDFLNKWKAWWSFWWENLILSISLDGTAKAGSSCWMLVNKINKPS